MLEQPSLSQNILQNSSASHESNFSLKNRLSGTSSTELTAPIEKTQPKQIVFIDSQI